MAFITEPQLAFVFGLLGNIVSFMVFLAPLPTFYTIYKKKSSEGYQCIPYEVALFSATLLLYYAFLKKNAYMIVSINGIGIVIELSYITMYLIYATKELRLLITAVILLNLTIFNFIGDEFLHSFKISTLRLILFFNVGGLSLLMLITMLLVKGPYRVAVVGWMCAVFNLAVFAAPLSVMRTVIKTKSVEFMPFTLSFFLTLCAVSWFFYGFFVKDFYIAVPNVMGFLFGVLQMILFFIYKDSPKNASVDTKPQDQGATDMQLNPAVVNKNDLEMHIVIS